MELFIYVLLLLTNKYYIGTTYNTTTTFINHVKGNENDWTRLYKPITIIESYSGPTDVDIVTKKYMQQYGITNVRGGSYSDVNLTENQLYTLKNDFQTNIDSYENFRDVFCREKEKITLMKNLIVHKKSIEIEPSIIDNYNLTIFSNITANYDLNTYPGYYKISEKERFAIHIIYLLFKKTFTEIFPIKFSKYSSIIQIIYKTYKIRKILEENLNQIIINNGFGLKDNYDDTLIEINKKIDLMYENQI